MRARLATLLLQSVLIAAAAAGEQSDPCGTDLSQPLDAYLCSEQKLSAAKAQMKAELAATLAALPVRRDQTAGTLVTRAQLQAAQAAWATHIQRHCTLVAELPGSAGDWHFPAANGNFCQLAETQRRLEYLRKWRECATDGGGVCPP
jgi:uncharacterized protein YecT (DUF1311 family)